jgi:2-keto-4-pentenoate hydratase
MKAAQAWAVRLDAAATDSKPVAPLSADGLAEVKMAYEVQDAVVALRLPSTTLQIMLSQKLWPTRITSVKWRSVM